MTKKQSTIEERFYREEDQGGFRFYQLSKELLHNDRYEKLSPGAILLYSVLFDRLLLSISNNRRDEKGRYYLNFKVKPARYDHRPLSEKPQRDRSLSEVLRANGKTITKYKKELREAELLVEESPGLGKVSRLYLMKPETSGVIMPPRTTQKTPPRKELFAPTEVTEFPPNDTDLTKTDFTDTDCSEIHPSKNNQTKNNKDHRDYSKKSANSQHPKEKKEGIPNHDQLHQRLQQRFGKEILGEALTIINRQSVTTFGYEKYLTKILEELTKRKKSQEAFLPSKAATTIPGTRPATNGAVKNTHHLKESRYRELPEEVINARIEAKLQRMR
ncbi:replication initiator protein A [Isachenkonia alkalipeptolytica]|uniref:Replication initiator A N-terminal domain-containing protein n=1 Tax=Isachenkonia alkalipeptolytica TaxID=2565777 RepID=A0AA43XPT7_9CLOT|nr:replication initiator protein A [Isachenkonia alkalipeptolytica]NBG89510.1 hypothetical protein [Isachenkonia alkalipeptolytica]